MKLIKPSVEILHTPLDFKEVLEQIELAARVCYKSECNIQYNEDNRSITAEPFVAKLLTCVVSPSVLFTIVKELPLVFSKIVFIAVKVYISSDKLLI